MAKINVVAKRPLKSEQNLGRHRFRRICIRMICQLWSRVDKKVLRALACLYTCECVTWKCRISRQISGKFIRARTKFIVTVQTKMRMQNVYHTFFIERCFTFSFRFHRSPHVPGIPRSKTHIPARDSFFYGFTLFTNRFLAMWNKNRCLLFWCPRHLRPRIPAEETENKTKKCLFLLTFCAKEWRTVRSNACLRVGLNTLVIRLP